MNISQARLHRRDLLKTLSALGVISVSAPLALSGCNRKTAISGDVIFSAQGKDSEHYALTWFGTQQTAHSALTGFRGHGAAQHPSEPWRIIMYARQPGRYAAEIDLRSGQISHVIKSPDGHHMHGHGVFSADGQWMFSVESDYRSGAGKILIRDTRNYQLAGEYLTHGIGPHQVLMMPDQKTLAVANGGLRTHPDSDRTILNLDKMDSSLVYLHAYSGELTGQYRLSESKASIRHLDATSDGTVAVATQVQRQAMSDHHLIPLAAVHRPGSDHLQPLQAPDNLIAQFNDYMGSVAISQRERIAGFTSPQGNIVAFWSIDSGELAGYHVFHNVCGLTTTEQGRYFVLSNSAGEVRYLSALSLQEDTERRQKFPGMHWDNHMFTFNISGKSA